jgi:aspartate 1-decarboxylase
MNVTLLKCKIHRARVTGAVLDYEGSISICPDLIKAAGLLPWEKVDIYNINTGHRFSTYVIEGKKGDICLNGAAARLVQANDLVIICAYASMPADEAPEFRPTVVLVDEKNRPVPVAVPKKSGGATLRTV